MRAHCPAEEQLERLLDDRLEAAEDAALARHVESCAECQARLERLFAGSLSSLGPAQTSSEMGDALRLRLKKRGRRGDETVQLPGKQPLVDRSGNGAVSLPEVPGYEVLSEIGRGEMGVIYKARHLRLGRVVARPTLVGLAAILFAENMLRRTAVSRAGRWRDLGRVSPVVVETYFEFTDGASRCQRRSACL